MRRGFEQHREVREERGVRRKGTVLWKNRADGPAEAQYRKIYGEDLRLLSAEEVKYFIRYSYQNDDEFFISPLSSSEVNLDFSNYWNHSCEPNTLPKDEDHWVAWRDIQEGEQLTIDYGTFDSNPCTYTRAHAGTRVRREIRTNTVQWPTG